MEKKNFVVSKIFVSVLMFVSLFSINVAHAQNPWEYHGEKTFGPKIMNFHMLNEKVKSIDDIVKNVKGRDFVMQFRISERGDPKNWIDFLTSNYETFKFYRASKKYNDFYNENKNEEFSYEEFNELINIDPEKFDFDINITTPDEKKAFYRTYIRNGVIEKFFIGSSFLDSSTTPYEEFVNKAIKKFGIKGKIVNSESYGSIISYVPHPEEGWNIRFTSDRSIEVFAIELSTF